MGSFVCGISTKLEIKDKKESALLQEVASVVCC
jgi:hypothetical protein